MNKIASKVAQAGLMALIGYEVGENTASRQVKYIAQEITPEKINTTGNESKYSEKDYFFVLLAVVLIIAFVILFRAVQKIKQVRRAPVLPIVPTQHN